MKRFIGILLSVIFVVALCVPAFADDQIQPHSSDQISSTVVNVSAWDDGQIAIDCKVSGTGRMTSIGMTKLVIYEKINNTWSIKEIRKLSAHPEWMSYNAFNFGITEWYDGTVGRDYYVQATYEATNDKGTDSRTFTSAIVTAKAKA